MSFLTADFRVESPYQTQIVFAIIFYLSVRLKSLSKVLSGTTEVFHLSFPLMTLLVKLKFVKKIKHNLRSRVFSQSN